MITTYLSLATGTQVFKVCIYTELFLYIASSCFSLGGVFGCFFVWFFFLVLLLLLEFFVVIGFILVFVVVCLVFLNQILASYMEFALQKPEPFANFAHL